MFEKKYKCEKLCQYLPIQGTLIPDLRDLERIDTSNVEWILVVEKEVTRKKTYVDILMLTGMSRQFSINWPQVTSQKHHKMDQAFF